MLKFKYILLLMNLSYSVLFGCQYGGIDSEDIIQRVKRGDEADIDSIYKLMTSDRFFKQYDRNIDNTRTLENLLYDIAWIENTTSEKLIYALAMDDRFTGQFKDDSNGRYERSIYIVKALATFKPKIENEYYNILRKASTNAIISDQYALDALVTIGDRKSCEVIHDIYFQGKKPERNQLYYIECLYYGRNKHDVFKLIVMIAKQTPDIARRNTILDFLSSNIFDIPWLPGSLGLDVNYKSMNTEDRQKTIEFLHETIKDGWDEKSKAKLLKISEFIINLPPFINKTQPIDHNSKRPRPKVIYVR